MKDKRFRSRKLLAALLLSITAVAFLTCSPSYVLRAGFEEARILSRRRPISEVLADIATATGTRRKLDLVLQARTFADQQLGLAANESYTTYSWVDSDTLLLVVSAARKDRFEAYTWWFPIVGRVPYKGFFDFDEAHDAARELESAGYDAYVRPSAAFSTLGWFNDPLLNTVLRAADVSLVSTVVHEILHNSLYLAGQAGFNESFANFVGDRGAIEFFCAREGETAARCLQAEASWADNLIFGEALSELVGNLERVYKRSELSAIERVRLREQVFADWSERYRRDVVPKLRTTAFRTYADEPLNNARLIGTRLYYQRLDLFEAVYQKYGDLREATHAILRAARAGKTDPFRAVEALLQ